jgi:hypothetical protein
MIDLDVMENVAAFTDFQELQGKTGYSVIFYPKFHCELNFIEGFWCAAKH